MKKIFFYLLLLFSVGTVSSQVITTLNDQFDFTDRTWTNCNWDDQIYYRKIEKGHYHMEHRDAKGKYISFKKVYIEPNRPFSVQTDLIMTEGESSSGVALYLRNEKGNWYMFEVRPGSKSYWAGIYKYDGTFENWSSSSVAENGTPSESINGLNEINQLHISWQEAAIEFRINNSVVLNISAEKFGGTIPPLCYIGFQSSGKSKFYIDNVKIMQEIKEINLSVNVSKDFRRVKLPTFINSDHSERTPVITHDGKRLYFIRNGHPQNIPDINKDDSWYSDILNDTTYGIPKNLGSPINNNVNNAVISVSADNNSMMLLGVYNTDGSYKENGMSLTKVEKSGWSVPEKIEIDDYYNLGKYMEACLSYDRRVLILAVQRSDALGMNDLYVSFADKNGKYSRPKNMGPVINSNNYEITPFLAGDGKSMYFSTDGRKGFGGFDVYVSKRLDDTWLNWSEPVNLGPSINTPGYDAFFSIAASGKYAYIVGDMSGNKDIYRLQVPEANKPEPLAIVFGKVLNAKTLTPLSANVEVTELETDKEISTFYSSEKDGAYTILLQRGKKYAFRALKEGFYPVSLNVDLTMAQVSTETLQDLFLFPIEKGQTIRLNNIFFDFAKASLKSESYPELNRVFQFLAENKKIFILISGHTDNVGNDDTNLKLSDERAKSVVEYLISKGIAADRLISKGFGESKPVDTNDTEQGRSNNRRVEFTIQ